MKELGCQIVTLCHYLYWPSPSSLWRSYWSPSVVLRRAKRQADYLVGTALNSRKRRPNVCRACSSESRQASLCGTWKIQSELTPRANASLTPENFLFISECIVTSVKPKLRKKVEYINAFWKINAIRPEIKARRGRTRKLNLGLKANWGRLVKELGCQIVTQKLGSDAG